MDCLIKFTRLVFRHCSRYGNKYERFLVPAARITYFPERNFASYTGCITYGPISKTKKSVISDFNSSFLQLDSQIDFIQFET